MSPAVVIGGGPAGAGVAIQLARAGREVLLLEREAGPHDKVCGEFLSHEAVDALRRLGVDPEALGAARIGRLLVTAGARASGAVLPFNALSLSRRVLDEALLARASAVGAQVRRGVRVTELAAAGDGWDLRTQAGARFTVGQVFLATGKHDIKGWKRPPGRQADLIGFKLHLRLAPAQTQALANGVELHLFPGGYAGLERIEDGLVNLCLVVRRGRFAALGANWADLREALMCACPHLAARLDGATNAMARPLAITAIPYGYVRRHADGLWRLGDQAAVIPSFAGEGMAIALHSAELAAAYALAGRTPQAFQTALAGHVLAQVRGATVISQALVRPLAQGVIVGAVGLAPRIATAAARHTRLPARAQLA